MSDSSDSLELNQNDHKHHKKVTNNSQESQDDIVKKIKADFDKYKEEHTDLKRQLSRTIEENRELKERLSTMSKSNAQVNGVESNSSKPSNADTSFHEKLKYQIKSLTQEKESFEELWHNSQRTIVTLETEIAHYRRQLNQPTSIFALKNEFSRRLKESEEKVKDTERRLGEKDHELALVKSAKVETEAKLTQCEQKCKELSHYKQQLMEKYMKLEVSLNNYKKQIGTLMQDKLDLQNSLDVSQKTTKDHMLKEREAITKVQEALTLAETAIAEKEACLVREKDISEECDYLARTIGQVMEEAAKKVDEDFDRLRKDHQKEIERLQEIITKYKLQSDSLHKKLKSSDTRYKEADERIQTLAKANSLLDHDLQRASQTIVDLEMKIDTLQKGIKQEQDHSRICEEKAKELQELVENNKKVKVQWKQMTLDVTSKLQNKIKDLQEKIRKLEAEVKVLRTSLEIKNAGGSVRSLPQSPNNFLGSRVGSVTDGSMDRYPLK